MSMAVLVGANLKFGNVRLKDRIATHIVEHAGVALAALLPKHDLR